MDFQHGTIWQADGQLYIVDAAPGGLILWRASEDDPATRAVVPVGELLAYARMPDGNFARLLMGAPDSVPDISAALPGGQVTVEHVADSSEEYLFKRAMGYYQLQEGHVYRFLDQLLLAWKLPKHPDWDWTLGLYLLNPATYELIPRKQGKLFAYGKIGHDVWRYWYWQASVSVWSAEFDFEDLEHIGPCEPLYDEALDARFWEIMGDHW